jgi:hypothetical protein
MSPESRIWEIRPFGSMRGRRELVIGLAPFNPASPAYSTWLNEPILDLMDAALQRLERRKPLWLGVLRGFSVVFWLITGLKNRPVRGPGLQASRT